MTFESKRWSLATILFVLSALVMLSSCKKLAKQAFKQGAARSIDDVVVRQQTGKAIVLDSVGQRIGPTVLVEGASSFASIERHASAEAIGVKGSAPQPANIKPRQKIWIHPFGNASELPEAAEEYVQKRSDGYMIVSSDGTSREVATIPDVVEQLAGFNTKHKNVTIRFDGFNADEARSVLRAAEVRTKARLAGLIEPAPEFATRPLDFSKARLSEVLAGKSLPGEGSIGFLIDVPTEGLSLMFHINLAFKNASPEWLRETAAKLRAWIQEVLARFTRRDATSLEVGLELRRQINELLPGFERLDLTLQLEASDFTIVQREPPGHRGTRGLAS